MKTPNKDSNTRDLSRDWFDSSPDATKPHDSLNGSTTPPPSPDPPSSSRHRDPRMDRGDDFTTIDFGSIPPNMNEEHLRVFRTVVCHNKKNAILSGVDCESEGDCPYSHCLSWQRRNPYEFDYLPQMCPHLNLFREERIRDGKSKGALKVKNSCNSGQRCKFSHTKEEQLYHPHVYKTKLCNGWSHIPRQSRCTKYYCPFAHGEVELRRPQARGQQQQKPTYHPHHNKGGFHQVAPDTGPTSLRANRHGYYQRPSMMPPSPPMGMAPNLVPSTARDSVVPPPTDHLYMYHSQMDKHRCFRSGSRRSGLAPLIGDYPKFESAPFQPFSDKAANSQDMLKPRLTSMTSDHESQDIRGPIPESTSHHDSESERKADPMYFNYKGHSYPCELRGDQWYECVFTVKAVLPPETSRCITSKPVNITTNHWETPTDCNAPFVDPTTFFRSPPFVPSHLTQPTSMMFQGDMQSVSDFPRFPQQPSMLSMDPSAEFYQSRQMSMMHYGKSMENFINRVDLLSQGGGGLPSIDETLPPLDPSQVQTMMGTDLDFQRRFSRRDYDVNPHIVNISRRASISTRSIQGEVDAYGVDSQGNTAL